MSNNVERIMGVMTFQPMTVEALRELARKDDLVSAIVSNWLGKPCGPTCTHTHFEPPRG